MMRKLFPLMALTLLVGCSTNTDDLEAWLKEVHSRPVPPIKPLPEFKPYEPFEYQAENLRSPFMKVVPEAAAELANLDACSINDPKPDPNRPKEELEKISLQTLTMVGSIEKGGQRWALIRDENTGLVYQVTNGNHMGLDNGKVIEVNETYIKLLEIVPNGRGCWESRTVTLELGQ
ncbi:MAG: pilus assembly protein PilP [Gammaproteobacteria bacterium]|nr:MAG: pilus assembly protein PilP [Gammaproteobacteria bacterium]